MLQKRHIIRIFRIQNNRLCVQPSLLKNLCILRKRADAEAGQAALPRSKYITRSAQP